MEENNKEIVNNENVNEVMNTQQANSDGMLYNTQHQDEAATTSAVYGTTLQPTQVQLSQTTEMAPMQPSPVQLSQDYRKWHRCSLRQYSFRKIWD